MSKETVCSGCGACQSVCPTSAIHKVFSKDGWFTYEIDATKCKDCGLCSKVCPSNSEMENLIHFNESVKYSAWSLDSESILKSSSGGLAYEIGKVAIKNGYRVVGTVYDYHSNTACWEIADDVETLDRFRGSKYIQADTESVFRKILNNEGKYLVVGTPCQIYGMREAAKRLKSKSEFVFVDFVCHGVPSYHLWNAYLRECSKGEISFVSFRDKTYGWHNIALRIESEIGTSLEKRNKSSFFLAFDDGYFFNEQCYSCNLNNGNGVSDIRIGDCWGKEFQKNQIGVSRVLIGTEIGRKFFDSVKEYVRYAEIDMHLPASNKKNFNVFKRLRNEALNIAKNSKDLKSVVKFYRKKLPLKTRVFFSLRGNKLFMKIFELKSRLL